MNNIFYVYIYLDPRKPGNYIYGEYQFDYEPFYIGKGCKNRIYDHLNCNDNSYKTNKIKKIKSLNLQPIILKYSENLIECQSFRLEMDMINAIGRYDLGFGPLTNLTNGGEGTSGYLYKEESLNKMRKPKYNTDNMGRYERTEEIKNKISKIKTYQASLPDYKNGMEGKTHTEETKIIQRQKKLGKQYSDKVNKKKGHPGKLHPNFNKHLLESTKEKISKTLTEKTILISEYTEKLLSLNSFLMWAKKKNESERIAELEEQIRIYKLTKEVKN